MSRVPSDLVHVLPRNWIDAVLAHRADRAAAPLVCKLQDIVQVHGGESILIEDVQQLAVWICCDRATPHYDPFIGADECLAELYNAAGTTWPATIVLDESSRNSKQSVVGLLTAVSSAKAEWIALRALVREGWVPVPKHRDDGPDWIVELDGRRVSIEVKHKEDVRTWENRLGWAIRGLSCLPGMESLSAFEWFVSLPAAITVQQGSLQVRALWDGRMELASYLRSISSGLQSASYVRANGRAFEITALNDGRLSITHPIAGISLEAAPSKHPQYFSVITGAAEYVPSRMDAEHVEVLAEHVVKRKIGPLRASSPTECVWIIVWEVPPAWEIPMTRRWLHDELRSLSSNEALPPVALLPLGSFEWSRSRLLADDKAFALGLGTESGVR
ncbi:MAG: hypothetical protein ACKVWV_05580 [Planctomycetota bacterium]